MPVPEEPRDGAVVKLSLKKVDRRAQQDFLVLQAQT